MSAGIAPRVPKNRKVLQKIFEDPKPKLLVFVSKVTVAATFVTYGNLVCMALVYAVYANAQYTDSHRLH